MDNTRMQSMSFHLLYVTICKLYTLFHIIRTIRGFFIQNNYIKK